MEVRYVKIVLVPASTTDYSADSYCQWIAASIYYASAHPCFFTNHENAHTVSNLAWTRKNNHCK